MILPLKGSSGNRRYDQRVGYFVHMTEHFLLSVEPVDIKCILHNIITIQSRIIRVMINIKIPLPYSICYKEKKQLIS